MAGIAKGAFLRLLDNPPVAAPEVSVYELRDVEALNMFSSINKERVRGSQLARLIEKRGNLDEDTAGIDLGMIEATRKRIEEELGLARRAMWRRKNDQRIIGERIREAVVNRVENRILRGGLPPRSGGNTTRLDRSNSSHSGTSQRPGSDSELNHSASRDGFEDKSVDPDEDIGLLIKGKKRDYQVKDALTEEAFSIAYLDSCNPLNNGS
jgi:hypothetical protein